MPDPTYIKKIRTESGDLPIDYEALANKPEPYALPEATDSALGGVKVGDGLKIDASGVLSVDTATAVEQDNTKPITSGAVYAAINNRLLPSGGGEGQVLKKTSDNDYNTAWGDTVILTYTGNGLTVS